MCWFYQKRTAQLQHLCSNYCARVVNTGKKMSMWAPSTAACRGEGVQYRLLIPYTYAAEERQPRKAQVRLPKCWNRHLGTVNGFQQTCEAHNLYKAEDTRYGWQRSQIGRLGDLNLNLNSIFNVTSHILLGHRLPASWRCTQGAPAEKLPKFQGIDVHFWGDDKNNSAQRELRKVTEAAR